MSCRREGSTGRTVVAQGLSFLLSALLIVAPMSEALTAADEPGALNGAVLTVASDPAGASVYIDGRMIGQTPVSVDRLAAGDHRVRVVKAGYLENGRIVKVSAGKTSAVDVKLTRNLSASSSAQITTDDDGGIPKWVWYAAAGGGAAVAAWLILGGNDPPVAGTISASTSTALQGGTTVTFTSQGASDPDGDSLTYSWDFGDGTSGSGQTASKVFGSAGTFTVTLRVSDGKKDASTTTTVTVRNLSATWSGFVSGGWTATYSLTQNGTTITGNYTDSDGLFGSVTGSVTTTSPLIRLTINYTSFGFTGTFTANPSSDVNSMTGTYIEFDQSYSATLARR